MAFVLAPAAPLAAWLAELDKWSRNSPDFFVGRPIILDLAGIPLDQAAIAAADRDLGRTRHPDHGHRGRGDGPARSVAASGAQGGAGNGRRRGRRARRPPTRRDHPARQEPTTLLVETPIRSGQSVIFPYGDITVLGAVSSGAEVVAGGSIHVYGALRGRAMAGSMGNAKATDFLQQERSRADLDRRLLPDRRGNGCKPSQPADPVLARGSHPVDSSLGLKGGR